MPSLSQKRCPAISQLATSAKLTRQAGASLSGSELTPTSRYIRDKIFRQR
jgi:hypothetical protein